MRLALISLATAAVLAVPLSACETKIAKISAVCRPGDQPTETVHWFYTGKVDPTVIKRIPRAIDLTLHYSGTDPRPVPPITTYFYRQDGGALRVVSSAKATLPPHGTFTYHVDTGGYEPALTATGRGQPDEVAFIVAVDGSHFGGLLSPPTCGRWADLHLDIGLASDVPDLRDKHPLDMAAADWLEVSTLPTVVLRTEGPEVSTYAFFKAPIALTAATNETRVPEGVAAQAAAIGVTTATPTYAITGAPMLHGGGAALLTAAAAASPVGPSGATSGGTP